jgi:hypothetical protein
MPHAANNSGILTTPSNFEIDMGRVPTDSKTIFIPDKYSKRRKIMANGRK